MLRRVVLLIVIVATCSLCAQSQSLHLCIVQTKPDLETSYDPPAGRLAIEVYKQLSGKGLRNSLPPLRITALPASVQKDILPEVRSLQCEWVVQLWYADSDPSQASNRPDSIFFSLWNRATQRIVTRGTALLRLPGPAQLARPLRRIANPGAIVAQQVIKRLNQLY